MSEIFPIESLVSVSDDEYLPNKNICLLWLAECKGRWFIGV